MENTLYFLVEWNYITIGKWLLVGATSNFASFDPNNELSFHFFWVPTLIKITIYMAIFIMCCLQKYIIFPITLLFSAPVLHSAIFNIWQAITESFPYVFENLWGVSIIVQFILAIIGTIL